MSRNTHNELEAPQVTSLTGSINEDEPAQLFNFDALKESYEDDVNTEIAARFGSIALENEALGRESGSDAGADELVA